MDRKEPYMDDFTETPTIIEDRTSDEIRLLLEEEKKDRANGYLTLGSEAFAALAAGAAFMTLQYVTNDAVTKSFLYLLGGAFVVLLSPTYWNYHLSGVLNSIGHASSEIKYYENVIKSREN